MLLADGLSLSEVYSITIEVCFSPVTNTIYSWPDNIVYNFNIHHCKVLLEEIRVDNLRPRLHYYFIEKECLRARYDRIANFSKYLLINYNLLKFYINK